LEFSGDANIILFGEVYRDGDGADLFWCDGGAKVPVAVRLAGTNELLNSIPGELSGFGSWEGRHHPFVVFTESPMGDNPFLRAVRLDSTMGLNAVFCMHSAQVKQQCDSGLRTWKEASPLEQLLADNNVNIFDEVNEESSNVDKYAEELKSMYPFGRSL